MVLHRPKDKNARSRQIRRLRVRALDALKAAAEARSDEEHNAALDECRDALHSLLLGTMSAKMLAEFSGDYPSLLQPTLPLRSPSE